MSRKPTEDPKVRPPEAREDPARPTFRRFFRGHGAVAIALVLLSAFMLAAAATTSAANTTLQIVVLSNRADLVSGGDALVEVVLPAKTNPDKVKVDVDGQDVTSAFALRADGRFYGLVTGLRVGQNKVTARGPSGAARLTVTNHPIGGPVFSGPQVQPWFCDTEAAGLGAATDEDCNAPTVYRFFYKSALTGQFESYDPASPPLGALVASTTTDQGRTVPYVVRVETGTVNRSIYDVAVLFDPARPWQPWSPQAGWNHKLNWAFGCDGTPGHHQATDSICGSDLSPPSVVDFDPMLSRGFMVAASSLTNLGNTMNTTLHAETMMMVKERIVERYGSIRYTIGTGCSGGSIAQHGIANQYPGLLQGLRPECSFADVWSIATVNSFDCPLLNRYFDGASPELWPNVTQRDAVYGYGFGLSAVGDAPAGTAFCHSGGNYRPSWWDPSVGGSGDDSYSDPRPCVPSPQVYDAQTNPGGVRCSAQDYIANIVGYRPPDSWGTVEKSIGRGFANRFLDNVGVQYGLKALQSGQITPEQFVDLNEKIGGLDIDADWQESRTQADTIGVERMYRSGQIVEGKQLENVAIIAYRQDLNIDVHSNRQSDIAKQRILKANGQLGNRADWIEAGVSDLGRASFNVMDKWLSRVEADTSSDPLPDKIVRNRPDEAADGCRLNGQPTSAEACSTYSLDEDPRLVAGMPDTRDILKCQVKPLQRDDYGVTFTDAQWARLQQAFPTGVCDWSKPGVGQQVNTPWLTYAQGPGGQPLGPPPASTAIR